MKVVIYNFLQPEKGGGGVGVYMANLASELSGLGHEVLLLNSGHSYDLFRRVPRLKAWVDRYKRIEIVNSPVVAPAYFAFDNPDAYLDNKELDCLPIQLRTMIGVVDVFHFQNLEGLTVGFLRALRRVFPEARFLYSVHNYHAVCPSAHLWRRDSELCVDNRGGASCLDCIVHPSNSRIVMRGRPFAPLRSLLSKANPRIEEFAKMLVRRIVRALLARKAPSDRTASGGGGASGYLRWRDGNAALCRDVFDGVLAVSARTRDICVAYGLPADKVEVLYIGTKHKTAFERSTPIRTLKGDLHLGYLGYMRVDKGFGFLLDALEQMPSGLASRMRLTVAARRDKENALHPRLAGAVSRLKGFRFFDGFSHGTLDEVLDGVNLGLVPPLWEDNLPQVAIEIVSRGIPVLTSDRGGACEIASREAFSFPAGSVEAFLERLEAIADGRTPLDDFWGGRINLLSMQEHVTDLLSRYAGLLPGAGATQAA